MHDGNVGMSVGSKAVYVTPSGSYVNGNLEVSGEIKSADDIRATNRLYTAGAATGTGTNAVIHNGYVRLDSGSSRRYKHDIADLADYELLPEHLYDIPVRQFVFNDGYLAEGDEYEGKTVIGLIAEEVEEHYPIAVYHDDLKQTENWNVRYLVPPMLKLIQDQKKMLDAQQAQIDGLKDRVEALEANQITTE